MGFTSRDLDANTFVEGLQDYFSAILEYYDELYPLDERAVALMLRLRDEFRSSYPEETAPLCRYLGIGCATGALENRLAGEGFDITGIDIHGDMIATARRRMKRGLSTTRFFELSILEMGRFLKKNSCNIIGCLENTLTYVSDETLVRKFFHDAKGLLAPGGKLVVQTVNFDGISAGTPFVLPERSSVRVKLETGYRPDLGGTMSFDAELETGTGKRIILKKGISILPLSTDRIIDFGRAAGFQNAERYADYDCGKFSPDGESALIILS